VAVAESWVTMAGVWGLTVMGSAAHALAVAPLLASPEYEATK
jgi:nicotinic acid phosphoribosyltransferase